MEAEESQGGVAINLLPLLSKAERAHLNLGSLVSGDSETERYCWGFSFGWQNLNFVYLLFWLLEANDQYGRPFQ